MNGFGRLLVEFARTVGSLKRQFESLLYNKFGSHWLVDKQKKTRGQRGIFQGTISGINFHKIRPTYVQETKNSLIWHLWLLRACAENGLSLSRYIFFICEAYMPEYVYSDMLVILLVIS